VGHPSNPARCGGAISAAGALQRALKLGEGDENPPKKKPVGAKLRNWRVAIMRARAHQLGTVEAPDHRAAEAEAVKAFCLSEDQRKRLLILERS
jgi:hypothetical protein